MLFSVLSNTLKNREINPPDLSDSPEKHVNTVKNKKEILRIYKPSE